MTILDSVIAFPALDKADKDGLLAIGGDLSTERLLLAYKSGIFPWYNQEDPIMWWSPDPRCILLPSRLNVSKSMQTILNNGRFRFTVNKSFEAVITNCKLINTQKHKDSWITKPIIEAYLSLHQLGYAHSAEAWKDGELAGGLYGVKIGQVFFGESMFSKESNASKFAFIRYVQQLEQEGIQLIDCQLYTKHLESLGATMIRRKEFKKILEANC